MAMRTTINGGTNGRGEHIEWTSDIWQLWQEKVIDKLSDDDKKTPITSANYFTPRPAVDAYNRGSLYFGFTWTTADRQVFQTKWT